MWVTIRETKKKETGGNTMTIDEIVARVKPDYVAVDNPKGNIIKGNQILTPGSAEVSSVKIDFDPADGICMYVRIV